MGDGLMRVLGRCPLKRAAPLCLLILLLTACAEQSTLPKTIPVTIAGRTFQLETAFDPAMRQEGLSDRQTLPADGGMLFVFPIAEVQSFWMIRCNFPIDVIFLDGGGRVVSFTEMPVEPPETRNAPTHTYSSHWPAQFVIEINAGLLDSLNLKNGDKIALPLDRLKAAAR